jgi:hypothetical protein
LPCRLLEARTSAFGTKPRCDPSTGRSAVEGEAAVRRTHRPFVLMTQSRLLARGGAAVRARRSSRVTLAQMGPRRWVLGVPPSIVSSEATVSIPLPLRGCEDVAALARRRVRAFGSQISLVQ